MVIKYKCPSCWNIDYLSIFTFLGQCVICGYKPGRLVEVDVKGTLTWLRDNEGRPQDIQTPPKDRQKSLFDSCQEIRKRVK